MPIEFTCPECSEQNSVGPEFAGRRATCRPFCSAQVIVPQTSGMATSVAPLSTAMPQRQKSSGAPWIIILSVAVVVLLMCGGLLVGLLLPAVNAAREAGRRAACLNKMHQIALALRNYESTYGHFPPAMGGDKAHPMSWRVAILPFMEHNDLYNRYHKDQDWDSEANAEFRRLKLPDFVCPSDSEIGDGETSYVMITGKNTVGGLPDSKGRTLAELGGNASNTVMVIEVHGMKIPWAQPCDITLEQLLGRLQSGEPLGHRLTFNVALSDGSVRSFPVTTSAVALRQMVTVGAGKAAKVGDNSGDDDSE